MLRALYMCTVASPRQRKVASDQKGTVQRLSCPRVQMLRALYMCTVASEFIRLDRCLIKESAEATVYMCVTLSLSS